MKPDEQGKKKVWYSAVQHDMVQSSSSPHPGFFSLSLESSFCKDFLFLIYVGLTVDLGLRV